MNLIAFFLDEFFNFNLFWLTPIHAAIVITFFIRLISVRRPVGVAFAWLLIVILLPLLGVALYVLIGERPVGRNLMLKIDRMSKDYVAITGNMRQRFREDRKLLPLEGRALSLLALCPFVLSNLSSVLYRLGY